MMIPQQSYTILGPDSGCLREPAMMMLSHYAPLTIEA
jgi:hypothetical protein